MDAAVGTSLIGTWLASFVLGFTIPQAYQYFSAFPNDTLLKKSLVASSLLFSFGGLIGEYANVYLQLVTFWGRPALVFTPWPIFLSNICNALVAFIVNAFLISRFYIISKNIGWTVVLCAMVLFVFAMSLLAVVQFTDGENLRRAEKNALITSISLAVADFWIAASLIWTLLRMIRPFNGSRRIVRPIIIIALRNGCMTSLVTLAGMAAVVARVGNVSSIFYYLLGPLYVLTLLSNLNLRRKDQSSESKTRSSTGSRSVNSGVTPRTSIHMEQILGGRESLPD
ncbi:hypothetical protein C8R47DRAFT_1107039 [Mycena vitilis]|nr:hypothetical protein C8R47DRAFT_1107039 [Mycena vitilis]